MNGVKYSGVLVANVPHSSQSVTRTSSPCHEGAEPPLNEEDGFPSEEQKPADEEDAHRSPNKQQAEHQDADDQDMESSGAGLVNGGGSAVGGEGPVALPLLKDAVVS